MNKTTADKAQMLIDMIRTSVDQIDNQQHELGNTMLQHQPREDVDALLTMFKLQTEAIRLLGTISIAHLQATVGIDDD